ncbi:MAG TPA: phage tail tip lysozyme [Candidatus Saccharimonadales bacterium]|nr:phage tail tip lysozyme [Candidatus Saccharimonadales bacterium]
MNITQTIFSQKHPTEQTFGRRLAYMFMAIVIVVVYGGSAVLPVQAMSSDQQNVYQLGINYFDNEVKNGSYCGTGGGATVLNGSDNVEKAFNFFTGKGLAPEQAAGIVGNMYIESAGVNPAIQQDGSNDPFPKNGVGFGISQWTYTDRQAPLVALAKKEGQPVNTLPPQLDYVWQELNTTYKLALAKLKTTSTVPDAAVSFMINYEAPADHSPTGANARNRTAMALQIFTKYGGGSPGSAGTGNPCGSGTAISGDAVKTALAYAWHKTYPSPHFDMTTAYQKAIDKARANGEFVGGGSHPGIDCGGFVTRVMRDSGVDPHYNSSNGNTDVQWAYLRTHPEIYTQLPANISTNQLQPGDIAVNGVHTFIWVGHQAGFPGNIAQASYGGVSGIWFAPQAGTYSGGGLPYTFFRPK